MTKNKKGQHGGSHTEGSTEREREGGERGRESQAKAKEERAAELRAKLSNPENIIGSDAYARKHKLPPYDVD